MSARPILTVYYADLAAKQAVKATHATWANNAVANCTKHMAANTYGAMVAEVTDTRNGKLHAVIVYHVDGYGSIEVLFKRKRKGTRDGI